MLLKFHSEEPLWNFSLSMSGSPKWPHGQQQGNETNDKGVFSMAISVRIDVRNLQRQDGEQNMINYQTRGYLYQKGQATYLQYREGAEGLEGVQTTLKLEKNRVTLIRHGDISMKQVFENGLRDDGLYQTPYGSLALGTETSLVEMVLGFEEGRVRIFYDLYLGGAVSSANTLEITYQSFQEDKD